MKIKLLQLNMWAGTKWDAFADFIKQNDFDILTLQEVAGKDTHCGNVHCEIDCNQQVQDLLGSDYSGELTKTTTFTSNPETSYEGNAVFYKKDFTRTAKNVLTLYTGPQPFPSDATSFEEETRDALHVTLEKEGKKVEVISAHLAWAPTQHERPHQREQNKKLVEYISRFSSPFILAGDFNISLNEPTIVALEQHARNLSKEFHVANTIDNTNHVSWEKLKPGFPVDYIFVSPNVKVDHFEALENVHMSDHVGLVAELEI